MTHTLCGEVGIPTADGTITLSLPTDKAIDLEHYFGTSIIKVAFDKMHGAETSLEDSAIIYAAMTGRDIESNAECEEATIELRAKVGIWQGNKAMYECMMANLCPDLGDDERGKRKAALKAKAAKAAKPKTQH